MIEPLLQTESGDPNDRVSNVLNQNYVRQLRNDSPRAAGFRPLTPVFVGTEMLDWLLKRVPKKEETQAPERLQHVCHTEIQFKHSPATRIAILKEKWRSMSDVDVYQMVKELAQDFARGGSDGEAFWYAKLLTDCRIKIGRTKVIRCYKCDEELTVTP